MSNWIPIKDSRPPEKDWVLLYCPHLSPYVWVGYMDFRGEFTVKEPGGSEIWMFFKDDITHWMPLPELPDGA